MPNETWGELLARQERERANFRPKLRTYAVCLRGIWSEVYTVEALNEEEALAQAIALEQGNQNRDLDINGTDIDEL
jgi:hypothetical protein